MEAGEQGELALVRALPLASRDLRPAIAAALGDTRGTTGTAALRMALVEQGASEDLQCAALLSLVKRERAAATHDLLAGLASRHGAVRDYALIGLVHVAGESAWEPVFGPLRQLLSRQATRWAGVTPVMYALCYLTCRQSPGGDGPRRLVELLRKRWDRLEPKERDWVHAHWPAAAPGGPLAQQVAGTDQQAMSAYLADAPLLQPMSAPSLKERIASGQPPAPQWRYPE